MAFFTKLTLFSTSQPVAVNLELVRHFHTQPSHAYPIRRWRYGFGERDAGASPRASSVGAERLLSQAQTSTAHHPASLSFMRTGFSAEAACRSVSGIGQLPPPLAAPGLEPETRPGRARPPHEFASRARAAP